MKFLVAGMRCSPVEEVDDREPAVGQAYPVRTGTRSGCEARVVLSAERAGAAARRMLLQALRLDVMLVHQSEQMALPHVPPFN